MASIPHARHALLPPISVQGLLAMPRLNPTRCHSRQTASVAQDMPHGCKYPRMPCFQATGWATKSYSLEGLKACRTATDSPSSIGRKQPMKPPPGLA